MILQCPRCGTVRTWSKRTERKGPGACLCGAHAPWKVLKEMSKPGHVIVKSHLGEQELHGPDFRVDPNGWKTEPLRK